MSTSRRRFILASAAASLGTLAYPTLLEPRWFQVTHTPIGIPAENGVPGGRFRILHLSDLHLSLPVPLSMIETAINLGLAEKPDIVCLTGDYVTGRQGYDAVAYANLLTRLSAACPTFAVLGNHDGGAWSKAAKGSADHSAVDRILGAAGIEVLHNRAKPMEIRGCRFVLTGVGDLWSREVDPYPAFGGTGKAPIVVLAHNPDTKDLLRKIRWDLMLCGHTHGGQIVIPIRGAAFAPVRDHRYVAGLGVWEGRQIYVTRGVGNLHGVRLFCRPEVSILDVRIGNLAYT